jgi:CTP:molybdopterin cytidylyltransferase MocA
MRPMTVAAVRIHTGRSARFNFKKRHLPLVE